MQMKRLAKFVISFILTACSNQQSLPNDKIRPNVILTFKTGNNLVDRIGEIKNMPYRILNYKGSKITSVSWSCGDSLYWQIVKLGKDAIPFLIKKTQDSTVTDIKIPCRAGKLTVGTMAFMALDDIISIPYSLVFESQWDACEIDCDFGYPMGILEFINENPEEAHDKLVKWYDKYGQNIRREALKGTYQADCQKKYGIRYKLTIPIEIYRY
jgi:hypothetical protein